MTSLGADDGEVLEDGTGPGTLDGDNLLLDYARAEAAAYGDLVRAGGGRTEVDEALGLHVNDLSSPSPFGNTALLCHPIEPGSDDAVTARLRAFFGAEAGGPYLVFSPWRTGDWRGAGFVRVGHPPLMLRPPGPGHLEVDGLEIVEVGDGAGLAAFERTLVEAYPTPELQPWRPGSFLADAVLATRWRFFVGYLEGEAVATAASYVGDHLSVVEMVSARPEHRGLGLGSALTLAASRAEPTRPAMLISSDAGHRAYLRLGYLPLLRHTLWLGLR